MKKLILSLLVAVGLIGSASAQTLAARFQLNGNSTETISEAVGTSSGVTYVQSTINGVNATVANFDGTGAINYNNNLSSLQLGSSFSVSAWVNVSNWSTTGGNVNFTIFTIGNPSDFPSNPHQAALSVGFSQNNSDFNLYGKDDYPINSEGTASRASTTVIPYNSWDNRYLAITSGTWNLLTWTYDGSQISSFLNGSPLYQNGGWANGSNIKPYTNFSNVWIGTDNNTIAAGSSVNPYFNGLISEVHIYNGALSPNQVRTLATSPSLTTVPEPSTYALFGIGALALVIAYRRKVA
jgi:hypothetical protein